MNQYDRGDKPKLVAHFQQGGVDVDPDRVVLSIKAPDGTVEVLESQVTNTGVGYYTYEKLLTQTGTYSYRWEGIGTIEAAEEGSLFVRPSAF